MNTIKNIQYEYGKRISEAKIALEKDCIQTVKEKLKELNLDRLVRRKKDGTIGELKMWAYNDMRFYPLKKNGLPSERASGFVWNPEEEFEPAEEAKE